MFALRQHQFGIAGVIHFNFPFLPVNHQLRLYPRRPDKIKLHNRFPGITTPHQ